MLKAFDPVWQDLGCESAIAQARPEVAAILARALEGRELGFNDGVALGSVVGEDLVALVKAADELRRRRVGVSFITISPISPESLSAVRSMT